MSWGDWILLGCMVLSLEITIFIFLKLGRPSNWFKK